MNIISGIAVSKRLDQNQVWKGMLILVTFILFVLPLSNGIACDAPVGSFCVDFYQGDHLSGDVLATHKAPYIKYNWKNRSPIKGLKYDHFSARWRGQFQFQDGQYQFRALVDDGVRILLDGKVILDHWDDSTGTESEYHVQASPGEGRHLVEVEYFEATGNARLEVDWKWLQGGSETVSNSINQLQTSTRYHSEVSRDLNKAPLGTNLSGFSYSSSTVPFKDLLIQSGNVSVLKQNSNDPCPEQPTFDKQGYPNSLPNGCLIRIWSVFHILTDEFWPTGTTPYQPGHYVLLYHGQGKIRLGWDAKNVVYKGEGRIEFDVPSPKNGIQLEITAMEWNDPIRDMHIVHSNDEATFREQPFNEKWLALLEPFQVLRFMDWGGISVNRSVYQSRAISHTSQTITLPDSAPDNDGAFTDMVAMLNVNGKWPRIWVDRYDGATRTLHLNTPIEVSGEQPTVNIYDFLNRTWAERALPNVLGQASARDSEKGVAFETIIQLANILSVDPWISIPTAADDEFVEALATLIKKELSPNLKCYIEYSNETWNFGFPGYNYSEAKAGQLGLSGTWIPADAWQAYRAVEIFKIFNRVFEEPDIRENRKNSRLIRVLTSQTAWLDRAKKVMDWQMPNKAWPTQGIPAYKYADVWAATTYFYLNKDQALDALSIEELFRVQVDNINSLFGDTKNPGLMRQILAETRAKNLQLVAYEGGTHMLAPQNDSGLIAKVAQVNKDPRMKGVYTRLLEQWNTLYQEFGSSSIGVMNHYSDISRYGKWGYWGLLQSTYQDPATAPRYQAIIEYVSVP